MPASFRLVLLFLGTVFAGMVATMLAPALPLHAIAHGQAAPIASAASVTTAAPIARATRTDTTVWTRAVATRDLRRGDTLRADDFALTDTLVQRRPPYGLDTATPQAGWLVQRPIAEGEWLRRPAVTPMPAVTAGQPVHAHWTDGTVHLAVNAIALNTAPIGAAVSVRVGRTRRLDGIVIAPDSVRLR
jgi:flagella basal body P-ring formation protein FlgA